MSSVLLDASLSLPQESLQRVLRNESTAYAPTSLERGMKNFTLPAELLKFSIYNTVDLEVFNSTNFNSSVSSEDKEILVSIEELKLKSSSLSSSALSSVTSVIQEPLANHNFNENAMMKSTMKLNSKMTTSSSSSSSSFARPDVTWLRRTEYISSVRNTPTQGTNSNYSSSNSNYSMALSVDDAKNLLAKPVTFSQILKEVDETFIHNINDNHDNNDNIHNIHDIHDNHDNIHHPMKPSVTLLQSFPINFFDEKGLFNTPHGFAHCLFLGDNAGTENSILKVESEHVVTLLNNNENDDSIYKSCGDFDIQRSQNVLDSGNKSFVLMLPKFNAQTTVPALLTKINSNFSLRKRRSEKGKQSKSSIKIKIVRE